MDALILCAGLGTRLSPYTKKLPKPLMPIHGRPLLEYWLQILKNAGIHRVFINVHHLPDLIVDMVSHITSRHDIEIIILSEKKLLGSGGTIRKFFTHFTNDLLVIHGDNFGLSEINSFIQAHKEAALNSDKLYSLLTFNSSYPENCGIFELDRYGKVVGFEEKPLSPRSKIASGAIFLFQKNNLNKIHESRITDLSGEFIPLDFKNINLWHFDGSYVDIGNIDNLCFANSMPSVLTIDLVDRLWLVNFQNYCREIFNGCTLMMETFNEC